MSIQNVGGGGGVSTTFQSKKNSEQIYHYDDEYNSNYDKAAHKDNNSDFLDLIRYLINIYYIFILI